MRAKKRDGRAGNLSLVDHVHVDLRDGACHMDHRRAEGWRAQANVRIVCKGEPFFGDAEEVPIELVIPVFIVDHGDAVVARQQIPRCRGFEFATRDLSGPVVDRFRCVFRPTDWSSEDH